MTRSKLILVAGGAGFLGSHLCERLLGDGHRVVCLDNLQTGALANLRHAEREPGFSFIRHDITRPLPPSVTKRRFHQIYNLACAASPPLYQIDPEHTLLTSVLGAHHLLRLAERCDARFLLTSTSEVYGDPEVHPNQRIIGVTSTAPARAPATMRASGPPRPWHSTTIA